MMLSSDPSTVASSYYLERRLPTQHLLHTSPTPTPASLEAFAELDVSAPVVLEGWQSVAKLFGDPPAAVIASITTADWLVPRRKELWHFTSDTASAARAGTLRPSNQVFVGLARTAVSAAVVGVLQAGPVRHPEDFEGLTVDGVPVPWDPATAVEIWTMSLALDHLGPPHRLAEKLLRDYLAFVAETTLRGTTTTVVLVTFEANRRGHRFYERNGMKMVKKMTKTYYNRDTEIRAYWIVVDGTAEGDGGGATRKEVEVVLRM
ncbi:hypothetical protein HDU96_005588 [Phlyctochytrium bullatum]|nr:hypothetical protein HDU96_005588 [Phlyctochytrium bullatum]